MKLLFLAHRLPYPPHKGEKIRALNVLRHLSRRHEVYVGCPVDDVSDLHYVSELHAQVHKIVFESINMRVRKMLAPLALIRGRSISVACFHSRRLQDRIDDLIETEGFEGVLCSSSQMAEYVFKSRYADRLRSAIRVMDLIDVDSYKWHQYSLDSKPWIAWLFRREAYLLAAYERRIAREFDRVLVVSEREIQCFPPPQPQNVAVMSNGVDLEYFRPRAAAPPENAPTLVFTGVMDYRPNADGVCWFVERILPAIRQAVPAVHFYVVGSRPTARVRRLGRQPGVTVTGFVDDIRDYLAKASVCVVPLRIARGIQNKVLEAMAMGCPIVTTRAAFEGISATADRDLFVVEDEAGFASATIRLLGDPELARRTGTNARERVENVYSWSDNLGILDEAFATPSVPGCLPDQNRS